MYHGIINIRKEAGFTSHDVVAKLRGILKQKKIGHTGTLDPDAVGVLPVCLGSGTKLCDMLTDEDKEYEAVLRLGVRTDTQDMSGQVLEEREVNVTAEQVVKVIESFRGIYEQIPPMYSALKVNGHKLYELARAGKEVERKARTVQIKDIVIEKIELPLICFRIVCSKGTYIRTLCDDIGRNLGCCGAMEALTRTRVGRFRIEEAVSLSEVEALRDENKISDVIVKTDDMFPQLKTLVITDNLQKMAANGNRIPVRALPEMECRPEEQVRLYDKSGIFYGIYVYREKEDMLYPVKMFLQ